MQPLHRKSANAALIIVAAIAAAVLVNAIFSQVHLRFDLTAERIFTLSEVSDRTAAKLEEPVQIRAFISPNLPPPHHRLEQRVEELLAEYEAASRGRISYEIISPDDNDEVRELARGYGIENGIAASAGDPDSAHEVTLELVGNKYFSVQHPLIEASRTYNREGQYQENPSE